MIKEWQRTVTGLKHHQLRSGERLFRSALGKIWHSKWTSVRSLRQTQRSPQCSKRMLGHGGETRQQWKTDLVKRGLKKGKVHSWEWKNEQEGRWVKRYIQAWFCTALNASARNSIILSANNILSLNVERKIGFCNLTNRWHCTFIMKSKGKLFTLHINFKI